MTYKRLTFEFQTENKPLKKMQSKWRPKSIQQLTEDESLFHEGVKANIRYYTGTNERIITLPTMVTFYDVGAILPDESSLVRLNKSERFQISPETDNNYIANKPRK